MFENFDAFHKSQFFGVSLATMPSSRSIAAYSGSLFAALAIVFAIRGLIVAPAVQADAAVRILNADQTVTARPLESVRFQITLENCGEESIVVTGCEVGCRCTTPVNLPLTLPGNSKCDLSFCLSVGDTVGSTVNQTIRIYTMPPIPNLVANVTSQVSRNPKSGD